MSATAIPNSLTPQMVVGALAGITPDDAQQVLALAPPQHAQQIRQLTSHSSMQVQAVPRNPLTQSTPSTTSTSSNNLPDPGTNGLVARTASQTTAARTITPDATIVVGNGDGVAGNPTVARAAISGDVAIPAGSNAATLSASAVLSALANLTTDQAQAIIAAANQQHASQLSALMANSVMQVRAAFRSPFNLDPFAL